MIRSQGPRTWTSSLPPRFVSPVRIAITLYAICVASRASMLTGLYSHQLEAQDNTTSYLPTHPTIAHHFDQAGHMTALIGKMHFVDAQTHGFEYRLDFNDWLPSPYL